MPKKIPKTVDCLEIESIGLVTPGLKVSHPMFGLGVVEELFEFDTGEKTIRVNFEKFGSKALVPEFGRLTLAPEEPMNKEDASILSKLKGLFK